MRLEQRQTAPLVIDLQNDTVGEEGAFASSGVAAFARTHGVVHAALTFALTTVATRATADDVAAALVA